jgi:hypothetical protein
MYSCFIILKGWLFYVATLLDWREHRVNYKSTLTNLNLHTYLYNIPSLPASIADTHTELDNDCLNLLIWLVTTMVMFSSKRGGGSQYEWLLLRKS